MDAIWPSNASQAEWLVDGLERAAGRPVAGMRVALLGLTFKAGTDDLRESPAIRLGQVLLSRGATVVAWDPLAGAAGVGRAPGGRRRAPGVAPRRFGRAAPQSAVDACRGADAVVVATEWPEFAALDWAAIAPTMAGDLVVDGRRIVDAGAAAAAGLRVLSLGRRGGRAAALAGCRLVARRARLPAAQPVARAQDERRDEQPQPSPRRRRRGRPRLGRCDRARATGGARR